MTAATAASAAATTTAAATRLRAPLRRAAGLDLDREGGRINHL